MNSHEPRALRLARVAYRVLVRLYPRELRERYGAEMADAFAAQARDRHRSGGTPALMWLVFVTVWGALRMRGPGGGGSAPGNGGRTRTGGGAVEWTRELAQAVRRLRRRPGFTVVTVLTLALGVGAFASISGSVAGILVRPMPYPESGDLYWVWRDYWGAFTRGWLGGPDIARLRQHDEALEGLTAFRTGRANLSGPSGTDPVDVRVTMASPGFLDLLGVAPRLGPGFTPVEHAPDAPDEAVLGDALWRSAFDADPGLVGRDIYLDGSAYTVVGILPADFDFVVHSSLGNPQPADLYIPLSTDLAQRSAGNGSFAGLMRVRHGTPEAAVDAALASVAEGMDQEFFSNRGFRLWKVAMRQDLVADARTPLLAILGSAALLLLLLGANLATLFLARARGRAHDAAVRAALGAGRGALLRTALAEAVVVAGLGTGLGLILAAWGSSLLAAAAADVLPRAAELGFDLWTAAGGVGAALLLALLAMMGPAVRYASPGGSAGALREGGPARNAASGNRARGVLVAAQLALALTLVVGAGLLTRSLASLLREDPGFDLVPALTLRVAFSGTAYPDSATTVGAQQRLLERVRALPGVAEAGISNALPLGQETDQTNLAFPQSSVSVADDVDDGRLADIFSITPGYVEAAGLRVLEGRSLDRSDAGELTGVLIDDVLARRYFPDGGAVGASLVLRGDTLVVVGVVDQPRFYDVFRDDRGQVYLPRAYAVQSEARLVVRGAGPDLMALLPAVRRAVAGIDPGLAVAEVRSLRAIVREALDGERLNLSLVAAFALTALVLAGLGLYGVVSGTVLARRREIGLRMAMGAEGGRVVRLVLGQGLRLVAVGTALGLVAAWMLGRLLGALLHGVQPWDPVTYAGAAGLLVALALLASWLPARRATRIRPMEALRGE